MRRPREFHVGAALFIAAAVRERHLGKTVPGVESPRARVRLKGPELKSPGAMGAMPRMLDQGAAKAAPLKARIDIKMIDPSRPGGHHGGNPAIHDRDRHLIFAEHDIPHPTPRVVVGVRHRNEILDRAPGGEKYVGDRRRFVGRRPTNDSRDHAGGTADDVMRRFSLLRCTVAQSAPQR